MSGGHTVTGTAGRAAHHLADQVAEVVRLPVRAANRLATEPLAPDRVDDWGRDPGLVGRARALARVRWDVSIGGEQHLPPDGGALVVVNARRFALAPVYTALALGDLIDRPVRFVGRPDVAPFGTLLQRLGGLLPHVEELTNVLRAGELVVLGTDPTATGARAGALDHRIVGAAVAADVPAFPAAVSSSPLRRRARVEIGPRAEPVHTRRGPLAELELADHLREGIDRLASEVGCDRGPWPLGTWS